MIFFEKTAYLDLKHLHNMATIQEAFFSSWPQGILKEPREGGRRLPYKNDGVIVVPFMGLKFMVWYPLGCWNLKWLPSGADY